MPALSTIYHPAYEYILEKLRKARQEAGFRQDDVAELLGVAQRYISRLETVSRRVDFVELSYLAKLYGKPIEYFKPPLSKFRSNKKAMNSIRKAEANRKTTKKKSKKKKR